MPGPARIVAVIPAYNEAGHVGAVVAEARRHVDEVVVVDDGSRDDTAEEARAAGARVCRHLINRGLGGGLATGLRAALRMGADIVVTFDADGQHAPAEIDDVVRPILAGEADFVIGSRTLRRSGMPMRRRLANRLANAATAALFGVRVSDSQSGFRAFSRRAAEVIDLKTSRMEVSSEIVVEVSRHRLRIAEVPITVLYTRYSLSKGQSLRTGLSTLAKLIVRRTQ